MSKGVHKANQILDFRDLKILSFMDYYILRIDSFLKNFSETLKLTKLMIL